MGAGETGETDGHGIATCDEAGTDLGATLIRVAGGVLTGGDLTGGDVSGGGCLQIADRARPALPVVLVVAVALVDVDGRVLLAQRPEGKTMAGLWEFPGGKVHEGESPEAAVVRELKEELDLDIRESCLAPLTFASHAYDDFHLLMPLYVCRVWRGTPRAVEGQTLKWVRPLAMTSLPMPAADRPLIAFLRDYL